MPLKKPIEGESPATSLWEQELVVPRKFNDFYEEIAPTEKILLFGESNTGKTRWYLNILNYLKKQGLTKDQVLMCIIFPDRPTGITKLYDLVPKEFVENVLVFPVDTYEELVSSTSKAEKLLTEHHKKTGVHGWLVIELLEEAWRMAQDYYCRKAFGETLADLLAAKRQEIQRLMAAKGKEDRDTAYQALEGWKDWPVIKFFHNFNWIDRIKKMPFNTVFTAEVKEELNPDSIFHSVGVRPAGEKDNIHRVDTIIYLTHVGGRFFQQCFKLTGYNRLYSKIDITNKNGYEVHKQILQRFEKLGYKTSIMQEIEEEAGIKVKTKSNEAAQPSKTKEEAKKEETESKEDIWAF